MMQLSPLLFVTLLTAASAASPSSAQKRLGTDDLAKREEVCGRALIVSCVKAPSLSLLTDGGVWVTLKVRTAGTDPADERRILGSLRHRNVCATGTLTSRADAFRAAQFAHVSPT
jgi:hypothetical protein